MTRYYVYDLIDPATDETFYVGKGSGGRMNAHERDVRAGRVGFNLAKEGRIRDIIDAGASPIAKVISRHSHEAEAYAAEAERIASFSNLTNISPGGGRGSPERPVPVPFKLYADTCAKYAAFMAKNEGALAHPTFAAIIDIAGEMIVKNGDGPAVLWAIRQIREGAKSITLVLRPYNAATA